MVAFLHQNWWEYSNFNNVLNLPFDISTADTALRNQQKNCCTLSLNFCAPPLPYAMLVHVFQLCTEAWEVKYQKCNKRQDRLKIIIFLKCQEQFRVMNALGHEAILVPIMKRICQTKTCQFTLKEPQSQAQHPTVRMKFCSCSDQ